MTARRCLSFAVLTMTLFVAAGTALAEQEVWVIKSGRSTLELYESQLRDLEFRIEGLEETATAPSPSSVGMEPPIASFAVTEFSDLRFRVQDGEFLPYGIIGGNIRHSGGLSLVHEPSGFVADIHSLAVSFVPIKNDGPGGQPDPDNLFVRGGLAKGPYVLHATDAAIMFHYDESRLVIGCLTLKITEEWARSIGRPEYAGMSIGSMLIEGVSERQHGNSPPGPSQGNFGGFLDVKLGILNSITQKGHIGSYPTGTAGLSMATTSCNVGDVDVPWLAPMQEDHPTIAQQLYREKDGRFEQIGIAWLKHGFFALSNSQCTSCENPSNGTFLGVGCSDTYGSSNNASRSYLGPRSEVNPFTGVWECTGSYFAGGQPDCNDRRSQNGPFNSIDHRLEVQDADMGDPAATYYYEAYYIVRDDDSKMNNFGSRRCTMSWSGNSWSFNTPSSGNALLEGPAILRWDADMHSTVSIGPSDGDFIVSVKTTDLGGGMWRYQYTGFNFDSDRQAMTLLVPVAPSATISNVTFQDWDNDPGNDWTATVGATSVSWTTDSFGENPDANALSYALLFNFGFDANMPPIDTDAKLTLFKPGLGNQISAPTRAPSTLIAVEPGVAPPVARLSGARPNPLNAGTSIGFELSREGAVTLAIYDAGGRLVRTVLQNCLAAGDHQVEWDGTGTDGHRVAAGVYYYRLEAGDFVTSRSMVVID